MQNFIDTATQQLWSFEDDVAVAQQKNQYVFTTAHGAVLNVPATLQPYAGPTAAELLATAQESQIALVTAAYNVAIQQAVSFTTAAGVAKAFQADSGSQGVLLVATTGYNLAGATPSGFYWVASDNTQVPFILADLKGLYAVILAQGNTAFQRLQTLKKQVAAAQTVTEASAIAWG